MSVAAGPLAPVATAVAVLLGCPPGPAAAETVYHDVEYSVESSNGDGTMVVVYTADQRDHADPTEKHITRDVVDLPWEVSLRVGETQYNAGRGAPDSKPFRGLNLGVSVSAGETSLSDGLTDGSGKLNGAQAWDEWTGGAAFKSYFTCRIAVDGEVVAEQTMKGMCSARFTRRAGAHR